MKSTNSTMGKAMNRADAALLEDLQKLEDAAHPEGGAALSGRLQALATHLAEHFRLEEQGGYMDAVRKRQPRLEREVRQLEDEHGRLSSMLAELVKEAADPTADGSLRTRVHSWIEQMRQHEQRENILVEEAFNLDIPAED